MLDIFQELLLNILFIILFLLFVPLVLEKYKIKAKKKKWLMTIFYSLAIIGCITYPINITESYQIDLRLVPVIIGSLLGGLPTSIALWTVSIVTRFLIGGYGNGFYSTFFIASINLVVLSLLSYRFVNWTKKQRLVNTTLIALILSILVFVYLEVISQIMMGLEVKLVTISLITLTTFFVLYFMEVIKETTIITSRLAEAEKLELVSILASSVSHEVRNPLTVVKGFLQLMIHTELPKEKRDRYLKLSIDEVNRANEIIGDYLSFAKPQINKIERLDIKDVLNKTVQVIKPLANMNSIVMQGKIGTYLVIGDKHLFHQCFLNITKNSIEAMENGGGSLLIQTEEKNDNVVITISDTGVGMSKEQLSKLGQPFYTTKGENGTGLGMLTVFQILNDLNCTIKVSSQISKGTTFFIHIPLAMKGEEYNMINV